MKLYTVMALSIPGVGGGGEHLLCILQLFHPWLGAFAKIIIVKGIIIFAVTCKSVLGYFNFQCKCCKIFYRATPLSKL